MLYPTLNQPIMILMLFLAGLLAGVLFDVSRILTLLSGGDKISKHVLEMVATVCSFAVLFFVNLKFNFGRFRGYVVAVFAISFALQRIISSFLWTKLIKKWYSNIVQRRKAVGKRKKKQID